MLAANVVHVVAELKIVADHNRGREAIVAQVAKPEMLKMDSPEVSLSPGTFPPGTPISAVVLSVVEFKARRFSRVQPARASL